MHIEKYTVLKSPHIYKKHMAQYETRTHGRMLQVRNYLSVTIIESYEDNFALRLSYLKKWRAIFKGEIFIQTEETTSKESPCPTN